MHVCERKRIYVNIKELALSQCLDRCKLSRDGAIHTSVFKPEWKKCLKKFKNLQTVCLQNLSHVQEKRGCLTLKGKKFKLCLTFDEMFSILWQIMII